MINRIVEVVRAELNKDASGNFAPEDVNLMINNAVGESYEEMLFEINRLLNRENRGLTNIGLENLTEKIRERAQHYLAEETPLSYSSGVFSLPDDYRYFDLVSFDGEEIEMCKNNKDFKLIANLMNDNEGYPVGLKVGNTIKVLPATITSGVTLTYLRNPLQAKWTYNIINDIEIFDDTASDYVDIDIHPGAETDIILKVLKKFGINLGETDLVKIANQEEVQKFTAKNTN